MSNHLDRRELLWLTGYGVAGFLGQEITSAAVPCGAQQVQQKGIVAGHPEGAQAGMEILAAGGNAVDAAVTAGLVAGVVWPQMCGAGGYGGHMVIARTGGKGAIAIDFNTTAPRAARPDMFPLDKNGQVRDRVNEFGWQAAGVPGTLAGLQLALDRYGTRSLGQVMQPAIRYARDGFEVAPGVVSAIRGARARLAKDPASARLLLPGGEPPKAGSRLRNLDLAGLLEVLAKKNSVEPFYRGEIAKRIAAAFNKHGGLVTAEDLAAYRAREVEPLELNWRGCSIRTAPLTSGGLTVLQALAVLKALTWKKRDPKDPRTLHLRVEALRVAWDDRLRLFGDPDFAKVPVKRLLSEEYAKEVAGRVDEVVRKGTVLPSITDGRTADGTIHISAVDATGMMVALTLTHGGIFGAQVAVDGLGMILGHGMSRFDPRPKHPNAPGPGKRPLNNMCPTVVLHDGRPVLALGGRGGRRIPNAVFEVLTAYVGRQSFLEEAIKTPRLHTEGDVRLTMERGWSEADVKYLRKVGYKVTEGASAVVSAVGRSAKSEDVRSAGR